MFRGSQRNGWCIPASPLCGNARPLRAAVRRCQLPAILCGLLVLTGCNRGAYRASNLPRAYVAPVVHSAQHLDLSRLSQGSQQNEVVYPGDLVSVSVATGLELRGAGTWMLRVDDAGMVNVPLVGNVEVGGMELTSAEAAIHKASVAREIYRNPQVSVAIQKRRSNKITVLGAVNREGTYELPSNQSDLLAALVAAGGLADDADTVIEIRAPKSPVPSGDAAIARVGATDTDSNAPGRATLADFDEPAEWPPGPPAAPPAELPRSVRIDLASSNLQNVDHAVADGGVVMVMRRPEQMLQVIGLVKRPGQFEVPPDQEVRLLDAVAMAGGLSTEFADKVFVVRNVEGGGQSIMIQASLDKAKREQLENIRLKAGDVVSIEQTAVTFVMTELQKYVRFTVSAASRLTFF